MLTFIWRRQTEAPWEGYQLQRSTFIFIMIYIFSMFAMQALAFILEVFTGNTLSTAIANTAHLSGAAIGLLLARMPLFKGSTYEIHP
jgi:GlpG protein